MLRFYCGVLGCTVERRQDEIGLIQLRAGRSIVDLVPVDGKFGGAGGAAPGKEGHNLAGLLFLNVASAEEGCDLVLQGDVQAVVFDAPTLQYLAAKRGNGVLRVVGPIFASQKYVLPWPMAVRFVSGSTGHCSQCMKMGGTERFIASGSRRGSGVGILIVLEMPRSAVPSTAPNRLARLAPFSLAEEYPGSLPPRRRQPCLSGEPPLRTGRQCVRTRTGRDRSPRPPHCVGSRDW